MKYTIIFLLNYFLAPPSDSTFYNVVTADRSHCYIAVNTSIKDSTARVVIPNDELFLYFNERKGFNRKQYKEFIIPVLKGNLTVPIDSIDLGKYDFKKINDNHTVNKYAKMGIDEFLKHYFTKIEDKRMLSIANKNLIGSEEADVINALFNWRIPVTVDDETGFLIISYRP